MKRILSTDLVAELIRADNNACSELRDRIDNVRWSTGSTIRFTLDDKPMVGVLTGRNADLVLGHGADLDKSIALRVLLDGYAEHAS
jgi:hypothetical protein